MSFNFPIFIPFQGCEPWKCSLSRLHSNYFTEEENSAKGNHLYKPYSDSVPSPIHTFLYKSVELITTCFESKLYFKIIFNYKIMQTSRSFFKFLECLELVLKGLITYYNETLTVFLKHTKYRILIFSYLYFYSWFYKFYSVSLKAMFHKLRGFIEKLVFGETLHIKVVSTKINFMKIVWSKLHMCHFEQKKNLVCLKLRVFIEKSEDLRLRRQLGCSWYLECQTSSYCHSQGINLTGILPQRFLRDKEEVLDVIKAFPGLQRRIVK